MPTLRPSAHRLPLALALLAAAPAAQIPALTWKGSSHGAEFGTVVAVHGGHGSDHQVLVGCPEDDTFGEDAGAVYLLESNFGTVVRVHYGAAAGDRFGAAVIGLEDNDGDGWSEYAIGAPFADAAGTDAGQVQVFDGFDGHVTKTMTGVAAGDRFGSSIASLGFVAIVPFFPDGTPMLAIGAPYANGTGGTDSGKVYFRYYDGQSAILPPTEWSGTQANEHFGATMDGRWDRLIVGSPDHDGSAGSNTGRIQGFIRKYPLQGDLVLLENVGQAQGSAPNERFGSSVAIADWLSTASYIGGAPDAAAPYVRIYQADTSPLILVKTLTGTGRFGASICGLSPQTFHGNLAIGAPEKVTAGGTTGQVAIYAAGVLDQVIDGTQAGEEFGSALGGAQGTVWGSFGDAEYLAIGAPSADTSVSLAGRADLYHGSEFGGTWLEQALPAPPSKGERAGSAVAGLGDIDGDGVSDVLVGCPEADSSFSFPIPGERIDCGAARVVSGATGAVLRTHLGGSDGDRLGTSVAALGDINLDGVPDYVYGAPQTENTTDTRGYATAISGDTGSSLFSLTGVLNLGEFGAAVGGGSDVNGDGRKDILVGAPGTTNGSVYSYSGANGSLLGTLQGQAAGDRFGAAVAGMGADLTGDGRQEFLVGAPNAEQLSNTDAGRAYLLKSYTSFSQVNATSGFAASDHCGASVAPAGDVNADGVPDWIVGIPGYDSPATGAGRVRVVDGASVTGAQLQSLNGDGANDAFGTAVAGVGDVNGDGRPDWAAGGYEPNLFGVVGAGYVKVASGLDQSVLKTYTGGPGDGLGYALAPAGDLDGDGVGDLAVGGPFNDAQGSNSGLVHGWLMGSNSPWTNLGFALAGTAGLPSLSGTGTLVAGSAGALTLGSARPSALATLFIALSNGSAPFKGGTLVPVPPILTIPLLTSPAGDLTLPWASWPAGLSGASLYFQDAISDPAAVKGVALSSALKAAVP